MGKLEIQTKKNLNPRNPNKKKFFYIFGPKSQKLNKNPEIQTKKPKRIFFSCFVWRFRVFFWLPGFLFGFPYFFIWISGIRQKNK
jgi:hypothetical protein